MAKNEYAISVASRGCKLDVFCETESGKKVRIFYLGTVDTGRLLRFSKLHEYQELAESVETEYMNQLRTSVYHYIRRKNEQVASFTHTFVYKAPRKYAN